ncbi:MAG TPA: Spy/CpxP family protein refolding chaperone [Vicinamibacterales bacterium]
MTKRLGHVALALVGATALAALFAAVHASAQDQNTSQAPAPFMGRGRGGPMGPGGPMGMLPMLPHELQLTATQQDQIKAIAQTHRDEWKALADRARSAHDALNSAVTADTLDETTIRAKSADVAAVDADMAVARAHVHGEVMQLLTSDQKAKLKTLKAQFNARRPAPRGQQ